MTESMMAHDREFGQGEVSWEDVDLYRFFANLLGFPSRDRFDLLARVCSEEAIAGLCEWLKCEAPLPLPVMFQSFEQYESSYISVFDVGTPEPPVPLLESYYHEMIPAQQTVLENVWFHDVIRLKADTSVTSPDHLLVQLEFAASVRYLLEHCDSELQRQDLCRLERDFLERHMLSWLPAALAKLESLSPPVLPVMFALLMQFLRGRHEELGPLCPAAPVRV